MKILFVCTGNVFRSASADLALKKYIKYHNLVGWESGSAGIVARPQNMNPETIIDLKSFGIDPSIHVQRKLTGEILQNYDIVVAMAKNHYDFVKPMLKKNNKLFYFNELAKGEKTSIWDIEDDVKDYATNPQGIINKVDKTVNYIVENIPNLVKGVKNL